MKRSAATGSWTQDTPGLSHQCSTTQPRQPDNHQPSQFSICTVRVVLNASVGTWQPLSMCRQNSIKGRPENSLHHKRTSFLTLNAQSILPHTGNKSYEAKIEKSEKFGSHQESNPGHHWLEAPVLCHWALTARQPPTVQDMSYTDMSYTDMSYTDMWRSC